MIAGEIKSIPLSTDDLTFLFEEPEFCVTIDYNKSRLKTEAFITYITNMKIICNLTDYQSMPYADKAELLNLFATHNYPVNCDTFKYALASVLLYSRSNELSFDYFTKEEMEQYLKDNLSELDLMINFFDSMLFVLPSLSEEYKETVFIPALESGEIKTVDDIDAVGINAFGLIQVPNFIDFFIGLSKEDTQLTYYKYQIENFIYNKKSFFGLILDLKGSCLLMGLFNLLTSTDVEEVKFFEDLKNGAA